MRPLATGIELGLATTDEQLSQVADAQNEAYGQPETTDHDVARLRGTVYGGGLVALARGHHYRPRSRRRARGPTS